MRKVKCKRCGQYQEVDKAYLHVHITKGGNKQNKYYCTKECYDKVQNDIYMLKQCQYWVDDLFGYVVVNNAKNTNIKQIVDAGYTRQELFECMTELKNSISESLNYRQDIEDEYQRIQYVFAIIKSKIKQVTENNRLIKVKKEIKQVELNEVSDFIDKPVRQLKAPQTQGKTLMDIIKGR